MNKMSDRPSNFLILLSLVCCVPDLAVSFADRHKMSVKEKVYKSRKN